MYANERCSLLLCSLSIFFLLGEGGRGGGGERGGALAPRATCAPVIFASSPLFSRALSLGPGLARAGPEQKDQRAYVQQKYVLRDRRIDFQKR